MTGRDVASVGALEDPVRRRLYEIVSARDEPTGRDEVAAAAGVGRSLAAYHLDKLVKSGLLTVSYARLGGRSGPGAGRPAKLYARSDREFAVTLPPRAYELAARIMARALSGDQRVREAAHRMGTELATPGEGLDQVLAAHGYEPSGRCPVIRLRNCPFHQLAAEHRDLICGMNLSLIDGIVDGLNLPGWRPVLDPRPGYCCVAIEATENQFEETRL